jgi:hypothetical protein
MTSGHSTKRRLLSADRAVGRRHGIMIIKGRPATGTAFKEALCDDSAFT